MDTDSLQHQLELWRRWLYVCVGGAVTLLATAIAEIPNMNGYMFTGYYPGWIWVWLIFQIAITPAGFAILLGKSWRMLPLADRLSTGYGFLLASWVTFLAFGIKSAGTSAMSEAIGVLILVFAGLLPVSYFWLKRLRLRTAEELFP